MKTRIIHTKFWKDGYVSKLSQVETLAFIYLFTNENVNMCGIYELNDIEMRIWLKSTEAEIEKIKEKFHKDKKILFKDGWVCLTNHNKYNSYGRGEKQETALKRELSLIPQPIIEYFNTSIDTSIGGVSILALIHNTETLIHNTEIQAHKTKEREVVNEDIDPSEIPF